MALGAGFLAVRSHAELFVTPHALLVIGIHCPGNQLLGWFVVADRTVGKHGIKLYSSLLRYGIAQGLKGVARGAALFFVCKKALVTAHATGVYGVGLIRRGARFGLFARGRTRFMAVCAALWFWFDTGIFMVTISAFKPQFRLVPLMSPFFWRSFVMVAGDTCRVVIDACGVCFYKGGIICDTVACFTSLYVRSFFFAFVMAGLARNIIVNCMTRMRKDYRTSCVGQEYSLRYILARYWHDIPHQGYG